MKIYWAGIPHYLTNHPMHFPPQHPILMRKGLDVHLAGDAEFEQTFVTAPATINSGLGPLFNNTSCEACHPKDGRGASPEEGGKFDSMFLRISIPGTDPETCGGPKPVPGFGTQLFQRATFGVEPQADVTVHYKEETRHFADGEAYTLRTPRYDVKTLHTLSSRCYVFSKSCTACLWTRLDGCYSRGNDYCVSRRA